MKQVPAAHSDQAGPAGRWLWLLGTAAVVFAARLHEVYLYSGETPYLDQWDAEARAILVPWLQGKLSWTDFFAPHNEHIPAWTRLVVWLQAVGLGRWDPQLQATINAALHGLFAGVVAGWLRRNLPLWSAGGLTFLIIILWGLPFSWENSTWGFQAHTPLALLFVFLYIRGSFERVPGSTGWWLSQAAGLAALFTYGSMWAAAAAVMLTALWSAAPDRRRWLAAALLAAGGLGLMLHARAQQAPAATETLTTHSLREFLAAFLLQLGWPAAWPGACAVLGLPALLLALQLRSNARAANFDRVVVALAVWAVAQAAAFGFARGGGYIGFVSRYGDLLALGVAANGIALWRLAQAARSWRAAAITVLALGWVVTLAPGLNYISTRAHTEYFHGHSAVWALTRRDAVRQYLASRDLAALSSPAVRSALYPNPAIVAEALNQPGLRELLPVSLRPNATRARGDFVSAAGARVRSLWAAFGAAGLIVLLIAAWLTWSAVSAPAPVLTFTADSWRGPLLAAIAVVAGSLVFLWPKPFEFSAEKRWLALLAPPGTIEGLSFHITTDTTFPKDNLTGGANLSPADFRNLFYGTHIDGPSFIGEAQSSSFPIRSRWLIVPFAGFPVSEGNALRLRIEDAGGGTLIELTCPGPNPKLGEIDFWAVDVHEYPGRSARLMFYDGRNDAEGWVAAASPQSAEGPQRAATSRRDRASEPTRFGQAALGVVALAALLLGLAFTSRRRT